MRELLLNSCRCRFVTLVDDEDYEYLSQFNWAPFIRKQIEPVYVLAYGTMPGHATVYMHRVVWTRMHGSIPEGMTVDHIEHGEYGGLDNRRLNLRLATRKDQQGNRRKRSTHTSLFRGVSWDASRGKWIAHISIDDSSRNLGRFSTEEEAALAYDRAAFAHFGGFANLNFQRRAS